MMENSPRAMVFDQISIPAAVEPWICRPMSTPERSLLKAASRLTAAMATRPTSPENSTDIPKKTKNST